MIEGKDLKQILEDSDSFLMYLIQTYDEKSVWTSEVMLELGFPAQAAEPERSVLALYLTCKLDCKSVIVGEGSIIIDGQINQFDLLMVPTPAWMNTFNSNLLDVVRRVKDNMALDGYADKDLALMALGMTQAQIESVPIASTMDESLDHAQRVVDQFVEYCLCPACGSEIVVKGVCPKCGEVGSKIQ